MIFTSVIYIKLISFAVERKTRICNSIRTSTNNRTDICGIFFICGNVVITEHNVDAVENPRIHSRAVSNNLDNRAVRIFQLVYVDCTTICERSKNFFVDFHHSTSNTHKYAAKSVSIFSIATPAYINSSPKKVFS